MSGKITSLPIAILLGGMSLAGTDSVSKAAAYTVIGDVNRPGIYGLAEPTRVFDAVAHAGGFRDPKPADNEEIVVIRGEKRIKFDWTEFREGTNLDQNIFLRNNDTVLIKHREGPK